MFVSSFNTYIPTLNSQNIQKNNYHTSEINKYNKEFFITNKNDKKIDSKLPIDYISDLKSISNRQKLQNQNSTTTSKTKYSKIYTIKSAESAYSENSISFSASQAPQQTLNKQKDSLKYMSSSQALNIYVENSNYYKVTA